MRLAAIALLAAFALAGCSSVFVSTDGGKPDLRLYPGFVVISRGKSPAMGVKQIGVGLSLTCLDAALGVWSSKCVVIDDQVCTAAIIDGHVGPESRGLLNKLVNQAEADCLGAMETAQ